MGRHTHWCHCWDHAGVLLHGVIAVGVGLGAAGYVQEEMAIPVNMHDALGSPSPPSSTITHEATRLKTDSARKNTNARPDERTLCSGCEL